MTLLKKNNLQSIKYYGILRRYIGLCHSVAILIEIYVMRPKCHVRCDFKRMGLSQ